MLTRARNYWVATSRRGRVHASPVWGLWLGDEFWFSTDPQSRKGRDMARNSNVVVHLESGDEVVIIEGRVKRVAPDSIPRRLPGLYRMKYGFELDATNPSHGVYVASPHALYAWTEKDFPKSATRWSFARLE